jgi:hypothetical protein
MPKGAVIATNLVLGVGFASMAGALENSRTARGWVSAVDTGTKIIKLKGKNDEVSFMLGDGGRVMEQSNVVTFADLRPGEHVMIRYTGSETDRVASEVHILARA